jgi:hypothetical protein
MLTWQCDDSLHLGASVWLVSPAAVAGGVEGCSLSELPGGSFMVSLKYGSRRRACCAPCLAPMQQRRWGVPRVVVM